MKKVLLTAMALVSSMTLSFAETRTYATFGEPASGGSWDAENQVYSWTLGYSNLMPIFNFSNGELADYTQLWMTTTDYQTGPYRLVFMNGNDVKATIAFYSEGAKIITFAERSEFDGVDLSTINSIRFGGASASGSIGIDPATVFLYSPKTLGGEDPNAIDLTDAMFRQWTAPDETGTDNGKAYGFFEIGTAKDQGSTLIGGGGVSYLEYFDLTDYCQITLKGTGRARLLFNRTEDGGAVVEKLLDLTETGVSLNLTTLDEKPFAHLHAIKNPWGAPLLTITGITLSPKVDADVEVGSFGYATFYNAYSCAIPEGVEAFAGTVSGSSLQLSPISSVIPAKTGVVLKASGNATYRFKPITGIVSSVAANDLEGGTGADAADGDLVLGYVDGQVGFFGFKGTLLENKAYLPASKYAGKSIVNFVFAEEAQTTGIQSLSAPSVDAPAFDLQGRRTSGRGLQVRNGKVILIK